MRGLQRDLVIQLSFNHVVWLIETLKKEIEREKFWTAVAGKMKECHNFE